MIWTMTTFQWRRLMCTGPAGRLFTEMLFLSLLTSNLQRRRLVPLAFLVGLGGTFWCFFHVHARRNNTLFCSFSVVDSGATSEASSAASSATNSPMLQFLANGSVVAAPGATQAALESMLAAAGIAASGAATARTEGTPDALDLPPPANHTNNAGTIHNASATDTADDRPDAMPLLSLGPGANETSAGSISDRCVR